VSLPGAYPGCSNRRRRRRRRRGAKLTTERFETPDDSETDRPHRIDLHSLAIADVGKQEPLRAFPEVRTEGGKRGAADATLSVREEARCPKGQRASCHAGASPDVLYQTGGLDLDGMINKMMIVISGKKIARMTQRNGLRPLLAASRNVK